MSYTLRGRLESRLAASALPFATAVALAGALGEWWPLQLAGLMIGVGLALDVAAYHPLLSYQPGWLALPLGVAELAIVMAMAIAIGVSAPVTVAVAFFAGSWLWAQVLAHAALPLLHVSYAEDGGELGRAGRPLALAAPVALVAVLGVAWTTQPPTVRLGAGVHQGPLVLDEEQRLVGERGAVVRGGILITADGVSVRDVTVVGGEHGIEVRDAVDVVLERVSVRGASLDGISARRSAVALRDCSVRSRGEYTQGIEISFATAAGASVVERCFVAGGREGIVAHLAPIEIRENVVVGTTLAAISVTEMSMGAVEDNDVHGALGIGIFCGDYSHCEIRRNRISGTRPDGVDPSRQGYGIVSHFGARAELEDNENADGAAAFIGAKLTQRDR